MTNRIVKTITAVLIAGSLGLQANSNLEIQTAKVEYLKELDLLVFSQKVKGQAGETTAELNGALNGANVLGYVFPTSLKSDDVGFNKTEGIVALALTSHPDFDDTPLWDENNDKNYYIILFYNTNHVTLIYYYFSMQNIIKIYVILRHITKL